MPSSEECLELCLGQLLLSDEISYRKMMGEYLIYFRGKVIGGIYDNRLLVKITKTSALMLPDGAKQQPYGGAKEMLLVDSSKDKVFLYKLFKSIYLDLPAAKAKTKPKTKHLQSKKK